ncbi:MAG: DUF1549 and DUF1553 domain-containing protein [Verrucomicrobiales bacterium]|nr:DUF1549 and DUF1553 domain-containing protein [Verrucomicrobiales bacterium]
MSVWKHFCRFRIIALAMILSPAAGEEPPYDYGEAQEFWAFQPPLSVSLESTSSEWARKKADYFVLKRLEKNGLQPNSEADSHALLRRVSYDLTGLPPDWESMRDLPYEEQVKRLLRSPHFGERWARLWLDVARFAEDQAHIVGNNSSLTYPNAYRFRDWVIEALNRDLPYDDFLRQQLAADLIAPDNESMHQALGFMGLGPKYYRRGDLAVMADEWEDRVDTLTRGVMGLTVACARCHDHFYDPIPTSDYYALAGVFASTEMFNRPLVDDCEMQKDGNTKKPDDAEHLVREAKEMKDLPVFDRGDISSPGPKVERGFLTVLGRGERTTFSKENSGRLDLANEIASPKNPLTARVWVNRVWGELFGQPLVSTTSNFGKLGEKPTHPELLDDLSWRFMHEGNWSLKWLVEEIVLSATYRQSSELAAEKARKDPANESLWRMNRRRLPVEMWRDSLFTATGDLDRTVGGPSFNVSNPNSNRRAVYASISRLQLDPMLALFDFPDPNLHSPFRSETTTPIQKLFVMNHPLLVNRARALASRMTGSPADSIEKGYELLFGRSPEPDERQLGLTYLKENSLEDYAQALLSLNEFAWLD